MAQINNGDKILDIGCGTGTLLIEIAKKYNAINGYGIDASGRMIDISKRKTKQEFNMLNFETAFAEKLPYANETFDCVFSIFLLHHLPMIQKIECLKEARRVLKPGKIFLLVDIDKPTTILGRIIGLTRFGVSQIYENMQQPLEDLLKQVGFSSIQLMRKDYGIFSFIRCKND